MLQFDEILPALLYICLIDGIGIGESDKKKTFYRQIEIKQYIIIVFVFFYLLTIYINVEAISL